MNEKLLEVIEEQMQQGLDDEVAKVRRAANVPIPDDFEGECMECGEPIPHGRLRTGAVTCIDCQRFIEKQHRAKKFNPKVDE